MYFNENKKNTNIDKEFKENKTILSTILENILKKWCIEKTLTCLLHEHVFLFSSSN